MRAAGVELQVDVDPAPRGDIAASMQLAVYRILQEALTNAMRHGRGGPVEVALAWHDDRVDLTVQNAVAARPASDPLVAPTEQAPRGHGLIGMRERALLVGGRVDAGPDGAGLGHRAFETDEQRVGHQRMADVQFVDTFDRGHGFDVVMVQAMAGIDDQPSLSPQFTPSMIRCSSSAASVGVVASA